MKLACFALWVVLAGDEDPRRVDPDRPTITNTTSMVPRGAVQIEAGVDAQVYGRASQDEFLVATPMIVRIGLHERVELRVFDGDPVRWGLGQTGARQQHEVSIGAKIKLFERGQRTKTSLGLQPQLLPVSPLGKETFWAPLPALLLLLSVEPGEWNISVNAGIKTAPADTGRCCEISDLFAASVSRALADQRLRLWGEVYARLDFPHTELAELAGDGGLMVHLHRRVALDAGVLVGRARRTLVVAVLAGLSVRFGGR
ncbi:hypothetical protein SAMN02745121_08030 [Nannocystis exedens]|uniref:Uncharacterized protein n=1 Tax=Nannocystis exedens TaxID=54 RepID=A0A1I2HNK7_9BACT|nr:transporter [Nannocystis exedens]PCC71991.1 hypothetical protein NAEX_05070 [Nannocystis exedens]SFF30407.1 hypothetical protein SAMN02745121_08030 [Nannocystis exedens]